MTKSKDLSMKPDEGLKVSIFQQVVGGGWSPLTTSESSKEELITFFNAVLGSQREQIQTLEKMVRDREKLIEHQAKEINKLKWLLEGRLDGKDFEVVAAQQGEQGTGPEDRETD